MALGHLGWNLQPAGGLTGLGTSPESIGRLFLTVGSGIGIEANKA
jgi:hypothetical protein